MKDTSPLILTLTTMVLTTFISDTKSNDNYLDFNVDCGTYLDVIPTDVKFTYIPYYVRLHRCQGKDKHLPGVGRECRPKNKTTISYKVEYSDTGQKGFLLLYNHTECEYVCENNITSCPSGQGWHEATCSCCEKDRQCFGNYVWNRTKCRCICPENRRCDGDYEWDREQCRCVCPITSKDNCGNLTPYPSVPTSLSTGDGDLKPNTSKVAGDNDQPCIKYQIVILIAVVEFIIVIALSILVFYFCFYYRRVEGRYNVSVREKKRSREHTKRQESFVIRNNDVSGKTGGDNNSSRLTNGDTRYVGDNRYERGNMNSASSDGTANEIDLPDKPPFTIHDSSI